MSKTIVITVLNRSGRRDDFYGGNGVWFQVLPPYSLLNLKVGRQKVFIADGAPARWFPVGLVFAFSHKFRPLAGDLFSVEVEPDGGMGS